MPPLTDTDAPNLTLGEQATLATTILGKRCKAVSKQTWGGSPENYTFEFLPTVIQIDRENNRVVVKVMYRDWGGRSSWYPTSAEIDNYHWEVLDAG